MSLLGLLPRLSQVFGIFWKFNFRLSGLRGGEVMLDVAGGASTAGGSREDWMAAELTIVIPAKNEVAMLPKLLESLCRQDYTGMSETRVLVADAGSTDGTVEMALS